MADRVKLLEGRRVVVTGASGGIGAAVAAGLRDAGAAVLISGRSSGLDDLAVSLGVSACRADLARAADRAALVAASEQELGGVDVLVAAHGEAHAIPSVDEDPTAFHRTLEVNLTATFDLCRQLAPAMIARGHGRIVLISSMYAFFGGLRVAAYTASKGGVAQLAKALSNEWAADGVTVNAIAPGYVRTGLNEHVWGDPVRSAEIVARTPAGRWGEPEDLVGPAVFLASDLSAFVTGAVLPVDGGFLAR